MRRFVLSLAFILAAGTASAMSDGQYTTEEQGCTNTGNGFNPGGPDHGQNAGADQCQTYRVNVGTDNNEKLLRVGLDHEEPNDQDGFNGGHMPPHHGTAWVGSPGEEIIGVHYGTGITQGGGAWSDDHTQPELELTQDPNPDNAEKIDQEPPRELHVYNGADDNMESGEHDGIPAQGCADPANCDDPNQDNSDIANGPSDGGAIRLDVTPERESETGSDDPAENAARDPIPAAYAGIGACVDGICFTGGTRERRVYDGGRDDEGGRLYLDNAEDADYADADDACDYQNEGSCVREDHDAQRDFWAHPGVTIYDDPDPQDSSLEGFPTGPGGTTHAGSGGLTVLGTSVLDLH